MLSEEGKNNVVSPALEARREQAEVSDVVSVAVGDVVRQRRQELSCGVDGLDDLPGSGILRQKADFLTVDLPESMLSDRWATGVPTCVPQNMPLALELLDVDILPALVL